MEEVFAIATSGYFFLEIAIGRGDDAHVDVTRGTVAETLYLALFEGAFALEPIVLDLLNQAAAAGWNRKETVGAIASVIANVLLADIANLKAEVAISAARNLN